MQSTSNVERKQAEWFQALQSFCLTSQPYCRIIFFVRSTKGVARISLVANDMGRRQQIFDLALRRRKDHPDRFVPKA